MNKNGHQPESTFHLLQTKGFEPEQSLMIRPLISVKEKGVKYQLKTTGRESSAVFAVDGRIITEGERCDKLIVINPIKNEDNSWMETFVELKGQNISRAIDQIRETLKNQLFYHPSNKIIRARIVGHSFPANKSNSVLEKAKQEFSKNYHCDLRGIKNGQIDSI